MFMTFWIYIYIITSLSLALLRGKRLKRLKRRTEVKDPPRGALNSSKNAPWALEPWSPGAVVPWSPEAIEPWNTGALELGDLATWNPEAEPSTRSKKRGTDQSKTPQSEIIHSPLWVFPRVDDSASELCCGASLMEPEIHPFVIAGKSAYNFDPSAGYILIYIYMSGLINWGSCFLIEAQEDTLALARGIVWGSC